MKFLIIVLSFSVLAVSLPAPARSGWAAKFKKPVPASLHALASQGKKNLLPGGGWFTWKFDKKPKLGTLIVKVQAFSKDGKRLTSYEITGECGMPAMRAHDSGTIKFLISKKGDYLMPVDVVMPGEWEVVIRVGKDGKEIYAGKVAFSV
ncbi:MAG TPA: hypothetical protein DER10_02720 [Elusimicrobia bacterium]|nr:MAG: hypothetical protein A2X33_05095 [Elusimicrobia bacterium GWA2_51_34]HAF95703.1 hypothetical protein [Elusimicrobiota bacterium]HCE97390.1 hypothetical protein [Elusimicrobiota bacterium]